MVDELAVDEAGEIMTSLVLTPTVTDAVGGDGGSQHDSDSGPPASNRGHRLHRRVAPELRSWTFQLIVVHNPPDPICPSRATSGSDAWRHQASR